jgi:TonB family protein
MGTNKVRRTVTPPAQPPAQEARKEPAPVPANPPAETVKPDPKPEPSAATTSKPKPDSATSGGLAVYENGKLVFQMQPKKPATEPSQPASKPQPSLASDVVSLPPDTASSYLLKRVEPEYPEDARRDRVEGPVVMNVIVSKDGNVRSLSVESGDGRLSQAASDAVRQWRFKPLHRAGAPVEFETRVTVNFTLP